MLGGEVPFRGRSPLVTMTAHLMEEPPRPTQKRLDGAISLNLEAVLLKALAKDPQSRFASARALAEAISVAVRAPTIPIAAEADALGDTDLNVLAAVARTEAQNVIARAQKDEQPALIRNGAENIAPNNSTKTAAAQAKFIAPNVGRDLEQVSSASMIESAALRMTLPSPQVDNEQLVFGPENEAAKNIETTNNEPVSTIALEPRPPWIWIAIAVVFAIIAIAAGVIVGAR